MRRSNRSAIIIVQAHNEYNWKKPPALHRAFAKWQNRLPLYNFTFKHTFSGSESALSLIYSTRVQNGLET